MRESLDAITETPDLAGALAHAATAWRLGSRARALPTEDDDEAVTDDEELDPLQEALRDGHIEAGILERDTPRESKFRLLREGELENVMNNG